MHIVVFRGGLGNQLFEYSLYHKYQCQGKKMRYLFHYWWNPHNGFELVKWFDVNPVLAPSFFIKLYAFLRPLFRRLVERQIRIPLLYDDEEHFDGKIKALYQLGYWQDKQFLEKGVIKFKELALSDANLALAKQMKETASVAIHIRRGDYLTTRNKKIGGSVCPIDYYHKAIALVREKIKSPQFFIFSDDIEWAKTNLILENSSYIDWNKGQDSVYDMYLMSLAKVNIIANSTFSFWSAYLNDHSEMVIYPLKWFNSAYKSPDIFPSDWLGI